MPGYARQRRLTRCTRPFRLTLEGRGISQSTSAASSGRAAAALVYRPPLTAHYSQWTSTVRLVDDWRATPRVDRDGAGWPLREWTAMMVLASHSESGPR